MKTTYAEILLKAQAISPDAKVRVGASQEWEIYIPTELAVEDEMPESYKVTPAWHAHNEANPNHGNVLAYWAYMKGHTGKPIEYIADYFNLQKKEGAAMSIYLNDLNKASGVNPDNFSNFSNDEFSQYTHNVDLASSKVDLPYAAELAEKWKHLG